MLFMQYVFQTLEAHTVMREISCFAFSFRKTLTPSIGPPSICFITAEDMGGTRSGGGAMCRLVLHGALVATAAAWAPAMPRPSTGRPAVDRAWASGGALTPPRAVRMMAAEAAVPVAPDPSRRGSLRRLMRLLSRSCLIWRCAAKQLIKVAIVKRRYKRSAVTDPDLIAARRQLAVDLRDTLIRLGPTFIKVGQLLSTRIDVLPVEVIQELARLQNDVPGFPAKRAKAIIAEELGAPVEELFKDFTDVPLAAASLAQVHRATLKDGREVVVKVRPYHCSATMVRVRVRVRVRLGSGGGRQGARRAGVG